MAGRFIFGTAIAALIAGSFYFYGDVQAGPQARLALLNPPITADLETATN